MNGAQVLTTPEIVSGNTRRDTDWLIDGNGWTTTMDANALVGFLMKNGTTSGSGKHWTGMYLTTGGPAEVNGTKTLWLRTWESLFGTKLSAKRALSTQTGYTLRTNVPIWVFEMDYAWKYNTLNAGNLWNGFQIQDATGAAIVDFKWMIDDAGYTGDDNICGMYLNNYYLYGPGHGTTAPAAFNQPMYDMLKAPVKHIKIICYDGKIYFKIGNTVIQTAAKGQWQNPGYFYINTEHYNPCGWHYIQNLKYSDIQSRTDVGVQ